jgi:hypothetical protein
MWRRGRRRVAVSHPPDEALLALSDGDISVEHSGLRHHVAGCPLCGERLAQLRTVRQLLQAVALHEIAPQHNVAQAALTRLHLRRAAIGNLNELLAALRTLLQGLSVLLGGPAPRHGAGRGIAATAHDCRLDQDGMVDQAQEDARHG